MSSSLALFARRAALVATRRLPTVTATTVLAARVAFSTNAKKINETLANKPTADYFTHSSEEFQALEEMLQKDLHIDFSDKAELQAIVDSAKKTFAVESPSGDADWLVKEELQEIQKIIGHSQKQTPEQRQELQARMAKMKAFVEEAERTIAVDAPDGASDADYQDELRKVQYIVNHSKTATPEQRQKLQDYMDKQKAMREDNEHTIAVDAPDGEPDGHIQEELLEVQKIIDEAALHEDQEFVKYEHKMEEAVRKERARDPEHDW